MSNRDRMMTPPPIERGGQGRPEVPADRKRNIPKVDAPRVPMDERREDIERLLHEHDNGVIIGETGSGKTTRIPEFLLDAHPQAKIAITQPRRVAARSVSRYVAARRGEEVGGEVGYQVRFEDQTTKGTRANFMTDGILLRKLSFDPLLTEYDIVMVDEAHERSLNIDFVLGLLKRVQAEREKRGMPQLKVIATSATIEKEKFANYFGSSPVIEVPGRMFPVDTQYEREPVRDYAKAAAERVKQIARGGQPGDVLIFMPGEEEIRRTIAEIESHNIPGIDVLPLFGSMAPEDQDKIFDKNPKRKVIVSTNIAETSLTIDGVRFVVDSGLIKQKEFDPSTGIEALLTRRHAKSGCEQRKGRAGRTASGTCYRLYTEQEYNERQPFQTPEINRSNLDHVILAMKKIGIEDVRTFDFIDKPKDAAIDSAIKTLKMLGALDDNERLTPMGETMAELPLRPELARMVIEAEKYGCTGSITTIAVMFGEKSIFVRPKEKEREADQAHAGFKREGSDFLTMLEVWKQWSAAGFNDKWARDRYLNVRQLFEVKEIRAQLMRELKRQDIAVEDRSATTENIQKSVAAGLIQHLLTASGRFSYDRVVNGGGESIMIHPSSASFEQKPKYMIGAEVVTTSKTFARKCQPVKAEWLPDIAPQLLEERNATATYDPARDAVEETVGYSLKGRYSYTTIVERRRAVTDETRVREEFLRALVEGRVDLPASAHNAESIKALESLRTRSGGLVALPDIKAFYEGRLGGAKSRREATYINDHLQLDVNEYCPPETKAEIDQKYPEVIEVAGHRLVVSYEYKPANPDGYYESDRVEAFKATITIPGDIIFRLNAEDIPELGGGGRPAIVYRSGDGYNALSDTNLENLKAEVDKKRLNEAWYRFAQPEAREVQVGVIDALPTPASLGLRPIAYAKDYQGNDVFAHPGYRAEQSYDYGKSAYVYKYRIEYFQTEDAAREANERATQYKEQEGAKERRRQDRETLMEPTRTRYEGMRAAMDNIYNDRALYGFSTDDYYRVNGRWGEVRSALESSDADPRKATEIMDELDRELSGGRAERERRAAMVGEVQAELAAMAANVTKIDYGSYAKYGLTYDQYNAISSKWREANDTLKDRDYNGARMPDPEKARALMQEVAAMIPSEIEFTPEQEALMGLLSGRDASFAKLVRVRGGKVTEYAQASSPNDVTPAPAEIPIGGSGRALKVRGNRLTFVYGSGNPGATYNLGDGDYVFGRDAATSIKVEEKQGAPYGFRAVEFVSASGYEEESAWDDRRSTGRRYEEPAPTPVVSSEPSGGFSGAFGALKNILGGGRKEERQPEPTRPVERSAASAPTPETAKPVEREKMTEEVRGELISILGDARIFLDTVRAVPEPTDKKATNADKISKARQKAADAKKDLNATETEVSTSDDAARARGKVGEIARRAERLAEEMARLRNEREDWTGQFKQFSTRMGEIAETQGVEIDDALRDKLRPKLAELAKRKGNIDDIDGELETILVDSI